MNEHDPGEVASAAPAPEPASEPPSTEGRVAPAFEWTTSIAAGVDPYKPAPRRSRGRTVLAAIIWIVAVPIVLSIERGAAVLAGRSSASNADQGQIWGSVIGAFLVALLIWGVVVWRSRRNPERKPRRLSSPVVPFIAIVLAFVQLTTATGSGADPRPAANANPGASPTASPTPARSVRSLVDVEAEFIIRAPYHFEPADAATEAAFTKNPEFTSIVGLKAIAVRAVHDGSGYVGVAAVLDVGLTAETERFFVTSSKVEIESSGGVVERVTIGNHPGITIQQEGVRIVFWAEAPLAKMVFTDDAAVSTRIADAFAGD